MNEENKHAIISLVLSIAIMIINIITFSIIIADFIRERKENENKDEQTAYYQEIELCRT